MSALYQPPGPLDDHTNIASKQPLEHDQAQAPDIPIRFQCTVPQHKINEGPEHTGHPSSAHSFDFIQRQQPISIPDASSPLPQLGGLRLSATHRSIVTLRPKGSVGKQYTSAAANPQRTAVCNPCSTAKTALFDAPATALHYKHLAAGKPVASTAHTLFIHAKSVTA